MQGPLVIIVGLLVFWVAVSGRASRVTEAWNTLRGKAAGEKGSALPQSDVDLLERVRRRREQLEEETQRLVDPASYHIGMITHSLRRENPITGGML